MTGQTVTVPDEHIWLGRCSRDVYDTFDGVIKGIEYRRHTGDTWALRGTKGRYDIFRDLRFAPWRSEALGEIAPAGFVKAVDDVMRHIARESDYRPVTITGHPLGGAVGLLAAAMLRNIGYPVRLVVTFGAPKVGRLDLLHDVDVFMYATDYVPVTKIPPGYGHCRDLARQVGKDLSRWQIFRAHAHFMDNYMHAMGVN